MKRHSAIGDELCRTVRSLESVRQIVRHHHERFNGSGYPDGLVGHQIPLLAQIVSVVDVFDALTTDRPYRAALPDTLAYKTLRSEAAAGWYRPDLVERFIELHRGGGLASANHAAASGASLLVIGKSLGHRSLAATQVYARMNLDPVRQSVDTATAAMMAAAKTIKNGESTVAATTAAPPPQTAPEAAEPSKRPRGRPKREKAAAQALGAGNANTPPPPLQGTDEAAAAAGKGGS